MLVPMPQRDFLRHIKTVLNPSGSCQLIQISKITTFKNLVDPRCPGSLVSLIRLPYRSKRIHRQLEWISEIMPNNFKLAAVHAASECQSSPVWVAIGPDGAPHQIGYRTSVGMRNL